MKTLRILLIILTLSVSSIVSAQQVLDSISFQYEEATIYIDAKIEGKNYRFIFDTGDPLTRVFPEVLEWKTTAQSKSPALECIKQTEVQIGTYVQKVDIYHFGDTQTCSEEVAGVIGYNFMKDKIWMIDYRQKKIYRLDVPPPVNKALHVIPIFMIPGKGLWKELLAEIKINGKPYVTKFNGRESRTFLKFDTGFGSKRGTTGLLLNRQFLIEKCGVPDSSYLIEVCGKQYQFLNPVNVDLTFVNNLTFSVETTGENITQALLGNAFFDRYKPVFDLKNNQLILLSY